MVVAPVGGVGRHRGTLAAVQLASGKLGSAAVVRLGVFLRGIDAGARVHRRGVHAVFTGGGSLPTHCDHRRDGACGGGLDSLAQQSQRAAHWTAVFATVISVVLLMVLTYEQSQQFGNPIELYQVTLLKNPNSWLAHVNLGKSLKQAGRLSEAIDQYRQSLALKADADTYTNLGNALEALEQFPEAMIQYQHALSLKPDDALAHNSIGVVLANQGRVQEAIAHYEAALDAKPRFAESALQPGFGARQDRSTAGCAGPFSACFATGAERCRSGDEHRLDLFPAKPTGGSCRCCAKSIGLGAVSRSDDGGSADCRVARFAPRRSVAAGIMCVTLRPVRRF